MEEDLSDLPEALIITKDGDSLRDDGIIYAKRMELAGSKVTLINDERGFHGDIILLSGPFKVKAAEDSVKKIVDFIKTVCQ